MIFVQLASADESGEEDILTTGWLIPDKSYVDVQEILVREFGEPAGSASVDFNTMILAGAQLASHEDTHVMGFGEPV